jgi:hypothetical protein
MKLNGGVDIEHLDPEMREVLTVIDECRQEALRRLIDADMVITSGCEGHPRDGVHARNSLHYQQNSPSGLGLAVDLRDKDYAEVWAGLLEERLGKPFDVVVEGDHLHVERDPKKVPLGPRSPTGATTG